MDFETVVLVTADTLRYDAVADSAREEYPFLQSLADRGVEFDGAYSTGSGTSSAFPGLLASAYPLDHGYRGLNDEHVPVAERLSEAGVRTVGVTSSSHASSLFRYDRGFDVFYENPSYRPGAVDNSSLPAFERAKRGFFDAARSVPVIKQVGEAALDTLGSLRGDEADHPYERAGTVTDRAIRTLEAEFDAYPNRRRFVWVHYMEPHAPYRPPDDVVAEADTEDLTKEFVNKVWEKWKADRPPLWKHDDNSDRFTERERRALEVFYRVQIRHLDREVGRLFEFLEGELDFERTALLFSSDHGEEFFDHGDLGHRPKLHDELVQFRSSRTARPSTGDRSVRRSATWTLDRPASTSSAVRPPNDGGGSRSSRFSRANPGPVTTTCSPRCATLADTAATLTRKWRSWQSPLTSEGTFGTSRPTGRLCIPATPPRRRAMK
jgi:arylsulfatase A-like enzyme